MTELCHTGRGLSEEFDDDFQNRLAAYFCRDHEFLTRAGDLVAPNQFSNAANSILVNMVSGYYRMYKSAPSSSAILDMLKRAKRDKTIREELFPDVVEAFKRILAEKLSDTTYMVDQVAMAIMAKVQQIGSNEATGIYDYFAESAERYKAREYEASDDYVPNSITTGLPLLDKLLYQKGWAKREMVLFMGFAKSGKSTAMGEFSINATLAGYNVLYLSLEVHTSILSDRFDARLSETEMSRLVERRDDVHRKLAELGATKGVGSLWIVERPSGSMSPADLDRMLGSMKANGMVPDMVVVDYADLMRASYDLRDDRANIRSIYTDLRALYDKHNVAGITASQTNREGGASEVATMMHAADNIEKVRIADLVITINKTEEEEAKGEARLYFAGSRNQKGGVSIRVKQNLEQMRFIERIMDVL
ncbi:TPA: DnaB-like helicase C-terminal domain-containing protein [Escherichia coli]